MFIYICMSIYKYVYTYIYTYVYTYILGWWDLVATSSSRMESSSFRSSRRHPSFSCRISSFSFDLPGVHVLGNLNGRAGL